MNAKLIKILNSTNQTVGEAYINNINGKTQSSLKKQTK